MEKGYKKRDIPYITNIPTAQNPERQLLILLKEAQDIEGTTNTEITREYYKDIMARAKYLYEQYPDLPRIKFPEYGF